MQRGRKPQRQLGQECSRLSREARWPGDGEPWGLVRTIGTSAVSETGPGGARGRRATEPDLGFEKVAAGRAEGGGAREGSSGGGGGGWVREEAGRTAHSHCHVHVRDDGAWQTWQDAAPRKWPLWRVLPWSRPRGPFASPARGRASPGGVQYGGPRGWRSGWGRYLEVRTDRA